MHHPENRILHRLALLPALVLLAVGVAVGQADQTDDFVEAEMRRQNIPGLSLVVLKDGEIIKAEGYGVADRRLGTPATPETVYKIASVSKQFIATGIMLLVQEGRLGLEDQIGAYLEEESATWDRITIRHLLTHTSGLVREAPGFDPFEIQSDADVIRTAYPLALRFEPGEQWQYSNLGYFVLAEIIGKITGSLWSDYLQEAIFRPSDMNSTRTTTAEEIPNLARGYTNNDLLLDADNWPAVRPSGAFLSTVLDLAKWDAMLHTNDILSESSRRQMWTPVTLNDGTSYPYGFGWQLGREVWDHRFVHHSGGLAGFRADFARFVDQGLTVIVLMNLDDSDPNAVFRGVATLYLPEQEPSEAR